MKGFKMGKSAGRAMSLGNGKPSYSGAGKAIKHTASKAASKAK